MGRLRRSTFRAFKCRLGVHRYYWAHGTHYQVWPARASWPIRQQICRDCDHRGARERTDA